MDRYVLLCVFSAEQVVGWSAKRREESVEVPGIPDPRAVCRGTMKTTLVLRFVLFVTLPSPGTEPGK
jgi:hypothetical protein